MGKGTQALHSARKSGGHRLACQTATAPCLAPAPVLASSSSSRVTQRRYAADTVEIKRLLKRGTCCSKVWYSL